MEFIPRMQGWFSLRISIDVIHHFYQLKKENISVYTEKKFQKLQHPFLMKLHSKLEIET